MTLTFDLLTLKVVSESRDVGYLCASFSHRPLCSRVTPDVRDSQTDVRQTPDRQTSDVRQKHRLMPRLLGAGHNNHIIISIRIMHVAATQKKSNTNTKI